MIKLRVKKVKRIIIWNEEISFQGSIFWWPKALLSARTFGTDSHAPLLESVEKPVQEPQLTNKSQTLHTGVHMIVTLLTVLCIFLCIQRLTRYLFARI